VRREGGDRDPVPGVPSGRRLAPDALEVFCDSEGLSSSTARRVAFAVSLGKSLLSSVRRRLGVLPGRALALAASTPGPRLSGLAVVAEAVRGFTQPSPTMGFVTPRSPGPRPCADCGV